MNTKTIAPPDLGKLNELAKVHALSYASPHHFTMSVSGLREVVAAIAALEAEPPKQEAERDWSTAQDWKGMDGAIAWHLIDRHADGWDDVGAMMNAWLAAQAEPQPTIPEGWGFCSADFSLQASGVSEFGGVMLIRTGADRADWHFLTDEQREVIPLYVSGTGKTIAKAIASAAKNCTPLPTPPKD